MKKFTFEEMPDKKVINYETRVKINGIVFDADDLYNLLSKMADHDRFFDSAFSISKEYVELLNKLGLDLRQATRGGYYSNSKTKIRYLMKIILKYKYNRRYWICSNCYKKVKDKTAPVKGNLHCEYHCKKKPQGCAECHRQSVRRTDNPKEGCYKCDAIPKRVKWYNNAGWRNSKDVD